RVPGRSWPRPTLHCLAFTPGCKPFEPRTAIVGCRRGVWSLSGNPTGAGVNGTSIGLMGLPASGKTTFLAAAWEVVSHADEVAGAPRLITIPAERRYLVQIHERWLKLEPALRT